MTASREWPTNCIKARDKSAERALKASRELQKVLNDPSVNDPHVLRQCAIASNHAQQIVRMMEKVGAKSVDPLEEDDGLELNPKFMEAIVHG